MLGQVGVLSSQLFSHLPGAQQHTAWSSDGSAGLLVPAWARLCALGKSLPSETVSEIEESYLASCN